MKLDSSRVGPGARFVEFFYTGIPRRRRTEREVAGRNSVTPARGGIALPPTDRILTGSTLPKFPQIRFTRGELFEASVVRTLLRPVSLLAPLNGSDRIAPAIGVFTSGLPAGR